MTTLRRFRRLQDLTSPMRAQARLASCDIWLFGCIQVAHADNICSDHNGSARSSRCVGFVLWHVRDTDNAVTVQGFFDVPVDNLYGRPLLKRYIMQNIPNYKEAVIISPDAGGAKRATAIADSMGVDFALIHKVNISKSSPPGSDSTRIQERRPTKITDRQNASMMLVGNVTDRVCILIDDIVDTGNTITRAAKLLKKEGASKIYALVTHGVFSGDAISRISASALDKVVVTNSVPQHEHKSLLGGKLDVLDISPIFAEAIRRVHHGESISVLFNYD